MDLFAFVLPRRWKGGKGQFDFLSFIPFANDKTIFKQTISYRNFFDIEMKFVPLELPFSICECFGEDKRKSTNT